MITKRLADGVNEIAVVECTLMLSGKNADFDVSQKKAEQNLMGTNPVEYIFDINRARMSGNVPIPIRVKTESGWKIVRPKIDENNLTQVPESIRGAIHIEEESNDSPRSRKLQWERKLLDLGMRNALINLRMSRSLIPILSSSLDKLEDALADGSDFRVIARPEEWSVPRDAMNFENMYDIHDISKIIHSEFKNKRLRSALTEAELTTAMKNLYRQAKTVMEENGANTL